MEEDPYSYTLEDVGRWMCVPITSSFHTSQPFSANKHR